MKFTQPIGTTLRDPAAENIHQNTDQRIRELQQLAAADLRVIRVTLPDGAAVTVRHGLGRRPLGVSLGPIAGARATGRIDDVGAVATTGTIDLAQVLLLRATGYGATITVDVWVV